MKLVVQRVLSASVTVDGAVVSSIGRGLLVLCGLSNNEEADSAEWCSRRLLGVKLWPNAEGKPWKSSVVDIDGELLLVSQFTLFHRLKGNSPDWSMAMPPDAARSAYSAFVACVQSQYSDQKASTLIHSCDSTAPKSLSYALYKNMPNCTSSPCQAAHGQTGQKRRIWRDDERRTRQRRPRHPNFGISLLISLVSFLSLSTRLFCSLGFQGTKIRE